MLTNNQIQIFCNTNTNKNNVNLNTNTNNNQAASSCSTSSSSFSIVPTSSSSASASASSSTSTSSSSSTSSLNSVRVAANNKAQMVNNQYVTSAKPANPGMSNPVQVQNYITWINSHLKKRPGVRLVENLQTDLASGVSLVHLIEVISGTVLTDVNLNPKTQADYRDNIEKILKFMQSNSIKMHQTTSKEIIEGNVKSIMRLVLALAAHYKPNNVQPYSTTMAAATASKMSTNNMQASSVTSASTNNLHQYNHVNYPNTNSNNNNNNYHHGATGPTISTTSSTNAVNKSPFANTSTTPPSNKQTFLVNKRSQSTNNVHLNNNTYLILNENHKKQPQPQHQHQQYSEQAPINTQSQFMKMSTLNNNNNQDKGRNLDSMTHLVQAACVSLADVRRYKNENFNIKYVKRNNLQSPSSLKSTASSNYLNPINLNNNNNNNNNNINNNQTYTLNNNNNNNRTVDLSPKAPNGIANNHNNQTTISVTSLMSPNFTQPIASSTVLQLNYPINSTLISPVVASTSNINKNVANQAINTKKITPKNITYVLNKEKSDKNEVAEENQTNELSHVNTNSSNNKISNTSNENRSTNSTYTSSNMNTNAAASESNASADQKDTKTLTANSSSTDTQQENLKPDKTSETRKLDLSRDMPDISELDLDDVQSVKHLLLNLQTLLMNGNLDEFKLSEMMDEQMCRKLDSSNLNNSVTGTNENGGTAEMNTSSANRSCNESSDSQDSDNRGSFALANLTPDEQICILRSKIQQLEILNADMRNELNAIKCETVNKNGIQSGLKTRISEQNNTILEMKNEQINLQLANEKLSKERDELNQQLGVYLVQLNNLRNEILLKDTVIDKLKIDINELRKEREQVKLVKQQVKQVSDTLDIVQEKENVLSNMISNTDRKLEIIDNKLNHNHHHHHGHHHKHAQKEFVLLANVNKNSSQMFVNHDELNNLKESIEKLRHNQNQSQSNQLLINQIEQSLTNIIEKFNLTNSTTNTTSCTSSTTTVMKNQINTNLISSSTTSTTSAASASSSSSGSSSLTSSSANSPVLALAQPTAPQSPSSSSSIHSTSSSSSSISANSLVVTAPTVQHHIPVAPSQQPTSASMINEPALINSESNVKKIISRLLSQNYLMNAANTNTNPHQLNYQSTQAHYQSQNLKASNENFSSSSNLGANKFNLKYNSNTLPRKELNSNNGSTTNLSHNSNNNNALLTISSASNLQTNSCYSTENLHPNSISLSCSNNSSSTNSSTNNNQCPSMLSSSNNTPSHFTKCIYYLDKNATPFMTTIYKNIGSVTLNDFKESVQLKSGNYRFRFKSHDPEFGPIKEEISIDNKPLPLFEGRIVAWIENF